MNECLILFRNQKKGELFIDIGKIEYFIEGSKLLLNNKIEIIKLKVKVKDKINSEALFYSIADRIPLV